MQRESGRPIHIFAIVARPELRSLVETLARTPGARPRRVHVLPNPSAALERIRRRGPFPVEPGGPRPDTPGLGSVRGESPPPEVLRPDLILLDLALPSGEGKRLLEAIKLDPHWRRIPVIGLTGTGEDALSDADVGAVYDDKVNCVVSMPEDATAQAATLAHLELFWLTLARLPGEECRGA